MRLCCCAPAVWHHLSAHKVNFSTFDISFRFISNFANERDRLRSPPKAHTARVYNRPLAARRSPLALRCLLFVAAITNVICETSPRTVKISWHLQIIWLLPLKHCLALLLLLLLLPLQCCQWAVVVCRLSFVACLWHVLWHTVFNLLYSKD